MIQGDVGSDFDGETIHPAARIAGGDSVVVNERAAKGAPVTRKGREDDAGL
jgi:hypothetical protein